MKATISDLKVPSFSSFRKIRPLSGKSLPSKNKLGTNKPLLTSFQHAKTESRGNSYSPKVSSRVVLKAKSASAPRFGLGKNIAKIAKLAMVAIVGLASAYGPSLMQISKNNRNLLVSVAVASTWGDDQVSVWWPADQVNVQGQQPFKAVVTNKALSDYKMYWQVDGGQLNQMQDSSTDSPHKESIVDLTGWNWKGSGPYTLDFSAYDGSGQKFAEKFLTIYVNRSDSQDPAGASQAAQSSVPTAPAASTNLVSSPAGSQVDLWWPVDGATVLGVQPFKAILKNSQLDSYILYWQVDGGSLNKMDDNFTDLPHKEARTDVSTWNWKGSGPYHLTFLAKDLNGNEIAQKSVDIYIPAAQSINGSQPAASVQAPVSCPDPVANNFTGCYYTDQNFGNFGFSRVDQSINFDWNNGSPDGKIPADHFSARWAGSFNFNAGDYTFTATADDGVRVYVDNNLVIDQWRDQAAATFSVTKNLSAGSHLVKMEYYENAGGATAKLSWAQGNNAQPAPVNASSANSDSGSAPTPAQLVSYNGGNSLSGARFYIDPNSNAKRQADAWRQSRPGDALLMDKIASQPNAFWLGGWNADVKGDVNNIVSAAASQGTVPVLIVYNIPNRDCGGYSAGGTQSPDAYQQWIRALAAGIGNRKAAIILEPDSVALTSCLSGSELQARYALLKDAVTVLKGLGQTSVYIDAGHANWVDANDMTGRLTSAGVGDADGFALNISNFTTTQDNVNYGQQISSKLNGKHFIIDTSRNGNGPSADNQWCNPTGRALGAKPTVDTGNPLLDALVWGKDPGGSDGTCNGGPSAGVFWPDYALGLAQRASW